MSPRRYPPQIEGAEILPYKTVDQSKPNARVLFNPVMAMAPVEGVDPLAQRAADKFLASLGYLEGEPTVADNQ